MSFIRYSSIYSLHVLIPRVKKRVEESNTVIGLECSIIKAANIKNKEDFAWRGDKRQQV